MGGARWAEARSDRSARGCPPRFPERSRGCVYRWRSSGWVSGGRSRWERARPQDRLGRRRPRPRFHGCARPRRASRDRNRAWRRRLRPRLRRNGGARRAPASMDPRGQTWSRSEIASFPPRLATRHPLQRERRSTLSGTVGVRGDVVPFGIAARRFRGSISGTYTPPRRELSTRIAPQEPPPKNRARAWAGRRLILVSPEEGVGLPARSR